MKVTIFNHKIDRASVPGRDNNLFISQKICIDMLLVYIAYPAGNEDCP